MGDQIVLAGLAGIAAYLTWCAAFPFRPCPRCAGKKTAGDGRGNYRERVRCWVCGGRPYRRFGARLIRRARHR